MERGGRRGRGIMNRPQWRWFCCYWSRQYVIMATPLDSWTSSKSLQTILKGDCIIAGMALIQKFTGRGGEGRGGEGTEERGGGDSVGTTRVQWLGTRARYLHSWTSWQGRDTDETMEGGISDHKCLRLFVTRIWWLWRGSRPRLGRLNPFTKSWHGGEGRGGVLLVLGCTDYGWTRTPHIVEPASRLAGWIS